MVRRKSPDSHVDQRYVTIFGAGVAGLTAAHELVERGFRVQVWEPAPDQRDPRRGLDVGGFARTQWSRVNWEAEPKSEGPGVQGEPIHHFTQRLYVLPRQWAPGERRVQVDEKWTSQGPGTLQNGATVEALIVGITAVSFKEQRKRVSAMFQALCGFFPERANAGSKPPEFQPLQQAFVGKLGDVDFIAPLREPAPSSSEVTAVLNIWSAGVPEEWTYVQEWTLDEKHVYGLARGGVERPQAIVQELLEELHEHREIDHVYVEITRRSTTSFTTREAKRRAKQIRDLLAAFCPETLFKVGSAKWGTDTIHVDLLRVEPGERDETGEKAAIAKKFDEAARSDDDDDGRPGKEVEQLPGTVRLELLLLEGIIDELPPQADAVFTFRPRERWLPGEHGFRFFPSFYHHLFDTMQRTPILETESSPYLFRAQEKSVGVWPSPYRYVETGRTAYDALKPSSTHALAFSGHRPSVLTRSKPQSFEELRDYLRVFYGSKEVGGFNANPRDVSLFMLKLLQYMTSCEERRREYEQMSWWDFIEGDRYEEGFADLLQRWPKALVAMDAKSADARTNGTTTVQITLDLFRDGGYRDGILKGPTNQVWLDPWRRYLEAQGVEFIQGKLKGLKVVATNDPNRPHAILPEVECYEPRYPQSDGQPDLLPGYFMLALSAHEVARIAQNFKASLDRSAQELERAKVPKSSVKELEHSYFPPGSDLERASRIDIRHIHEPITNDGVGEFRNYAGIQFYFAEDVFWLNGQVYHPDSEYGLTTVSQARFWEDKMDWENGYRGVLSVIIANWAKPSKKGKFEGKCAHQLSPQDLATEVWRQITDSVKGRNAQAPNVARSRTPTFDSPPEPIYWRLDENIRWEPTNAEKGEGRYRNHSPFHIIPPGKWPELPGELDEQRGYEVRAGIVLAGTYMKTYTRIPCMETANESARHAVNAILRDVSREQGCTYCDIWNPEDREVDDFGWFKDLDAKLKSRGSGHVFELYGMEKLIRYGLRGGADDPFDPLEAWRRLSGIIFKFGNVLWSK